jgi:hypothetical protein
MTHGAHAIRVLRLRPGRAPEVVEMDDSLDALQRAVGGHIEVVKAGEGLDLMVNEDGAHDVLGTFNGASIAGVALLVRKDAGGQLVDVTDADVGAVIAKFVPARTMN